jgi:hypothetical protein
MDSESESRRVKVSSDDRSRRQWAAIQKPEFILATAMVPVVTSLANTTGITFYVICGVTLVLCAFVGAAVIKQRKRAKRLRIAATRAENA